MTGDPREQQWLRRPRLWQWSQKMLPVFGLCASLIRLTRVLPVDHGHTQPTN